MKNLLYFATGDGADFTLESYTVLASNIAGIVPVDTLRTAVFFNKDLRGIDSTESKDKIVFRHDNTTTTSGHRCREIAAALASAANAGPHENGMTDVVDLDNSTYYTSPLGNISFITSFIVTLDV